MKTNLASSGIEFNPCDDGMRLVECPSCRGVGGGITKDGVEVDCSTCDGTGGVLRLVSDADIG